VWSIERGWERVTPPQMADASPPYPQTYQGEALREEIKNSTTQQTSPKWAISQINQNQGQEQLHTGNLCQKSTEKTIKSGVNTVNPEEIMNKIEVLTVRMERVIILLNVEHYQG